MIGLIEYLNCWIVSYVCQRRTLRESRLFGISSQSSKTQRKLNQKVSSGNNNLNKKITNEKLLSRQKQKD